jgi:hypothetical protein
MKIKNTLFILLAAPLLVGALNFDVMMPDGESSYQTYPFFLNIYNTENVLFSENILQGDNLLSGRCREISGSMYSFMSKRMYYDYVSKTGYSLLEMPGTTSYDISIIRDLLSTRIYASLGKEDSFLKLNSLSGVYIENNSVSQHQTEFYGEYKNILLDVNVLQEKFEALAGYSHKIFKSEIGINNSNQIIEREAVNFHGLFAYTDIRYNYKSKSIDGYLFSKYHINLGRLHIIPQVIYDSILTSRIGALYRILPEVSFYANYTRRADDNIISSVVKYFSTKFNAYIIPVFYDSGGFGSKASVDLFLKHIKLNANLSYQDSLLFDAFSSLSYPLLKGNFTPSLLIGYDSNKKLDLFINLRIIDVDIILGSRFFMDTKEYLIKGGVTWLFSD